MKTKLKPRDWLLILLPAAVCRGFVFWLRTGEPVFQKYLFLASHLADSGNRPFYSSPIYTIWVYLTSELMGFTPDILRLSQHLFGLLTVVVLVQTVYLLKGRVYAIASGLLYGLTLPVLIYESDLVTASLVIFVQSLAVLLLVSSLLERQSKSHHWLLSGLLTGISIGIRPNVMLSVPIIVLTLTGFRRISELKILRATTFLVGLILTIAPITLFNFVNTSEVIPVTGSGGSVFYSSNNFRATGLGYSAPPALTLVENQWMQQNRVDQPVEHAIFKFLAERASGRSLSHRETSSFYKQEGWRYLQESPPRSIRYFLRKALYTFNNYEVLDTASLVSAGKQINDNLPFLLPGGVIVVFGVFGMRFYRIRKREFWIVLSFMIPHALTGIIFYVNGRLRVPLLYFFCIFAGTGVVKLYKMIKLRDSSIWMSIFTLMGLAAFVGYQDDGIRRHSQVETPSFYASVQGLAALQSRDVVSAEKFYLEAVEFNPLGATEAWGNLELIYGRKGDKARAELCRQRAMGSWSLSDIGQMEGDDRFEEHELLMARARAHWTSGDRTSAMMYFQEALRLYPERPETWFNIAIGLSVAGSDWERVEVYSQEALNRGMKLSLDSVAAHRLRIKALEHLDRFEEAENVRKQLHWEQSLDFSPE